MAATGGAALIDLDLPNGGRLEHYTRANPSVIVAVAMALRLKRASDGLLPKLHGTCIFVEEDDDAVWPQREIVFRAD